MIHINRVFATDLFSYERLDVSLRDRGLILVDGSNGAGKTTIFEIILWTLFGRVQKKDVKASDCIREDIDHNPIKGNTQGYVQLDIDGQLVQVFRHRDHKQYGNRMRLSMGDVDLTQGTDVETQKKLCQLLGHDFETFCLVVLFPQGGSEFIGLGDATQKNYLDRIFHMERFGLAHERAKTALKATRERVLSGGARLGQLNIQVADTEQNVEKLKALEGTYQLNWETKKSTLQQECEAIAQSKPAADPALYQWLAAYAASGHEQAYATAQQALVDSRVARDTITKQQTTLRQQLQQIGTVVPPPPMRQPTGYNVRHLDVEIATLKAEISSINVAVADRHSDYHRIEAVIKQQTGICPTCGSKLNADQRDQIEGDNENLLNDISRDVVMLRSKQTEREQVLAETLSQKSSFDEYTKYLAVCKGFEAKQQIEVQLQKLDECLPVAEDIVLTNLSATRKLEEQRTNYLDVKQRYDTEQQAISQHTIKFLQRAQALKEHIELASPYTKLIEDNAVKAGKLKTEAVLLEQDLEVDRGLVDIYEFWETGFGNQGCKQLYYEHLLPAVTDRTNDYLATLADGRASCVFRGVTELSSGELRDKFSVSVQYACGGGSYAKNSGGEKRRIDLAALFAIGDISSRSAGRRVGIRLLDEPFEDLDPEGAERVVQVLEEQLVPEYGTVLVMTHNDNLKSLVRQRFHVEKSGNTSILYDQTSSSVRGT